MNSHHLVQPLLRRGLALTAAAVIALSPTLAWGQDCSSLRQEHDAVERQMISLIAQNPGIHIIIGLCAASANNTYERTRDSDRATGEFVVCAGVGCLFAGVDSCIDVAQQWYTLGMRASQIEDRLREGC